MVNFEILGLGLRLCIYSTVYLVTNVNVGKNTFLSFCEMKLKFFLAERYFTTPILLTKTTFNNICNLE